MSRTGVSQRALCMQSLVIDLVHRHSRKQLRFTHLQSTADWIRLGVTHKNEELAECPFGSSLATYCVAFHKHRHVPILLCSFHWIPTNLFSRAFKMYSSAQQSSRKALAAEPGTRASPRSWTVISKVCHICCWGGTLFSPNANLDGSSNEVRYSQQVLLTTRQRLVSLFVRPWTK